MAGGSVSMEVSAGSLPENRLFPAEKLVIAAISFFSLLIVVDHFLHRNREVYLAALSLPAILLFSVLPALRKKYHHKPGIFFVLSALSLGGYAYLYKLAGAVINLPGIGWKDEFLARLDRVVFGFNPNLIITWRPVWLTELMMFAYMAYLPLVVWLALMLYRQRGQLELQKYIFALGLAYVSCFLLFLLVPASSPRFYFENTTPAEGLFFRRVMELVESSAQYRGGSFPSAHCAAGAVMLYFALKAGRKVSLVVVPLIILFFISTVYGQYHYGVDVIAGILTGFLAVLAVRVASARRSEEN